MAVANKNIRRMYMALHCPDKPAVLAVRQGEQGAYDLPGLALDDLPPAKSVRNFDENVMAIAGMQCGLADVALHALRFLGWQKDEQGPFFVVEAEVAENSPQVPVGVRWICSSECESVGSPERQVTIRSVLAERDSPDPGRAPFERLGWRRSALAWIDKALSENGMGLRVLTEGRKTGSSWNCVLRVVTDKDREYYFKAVREWNHYEPSVSDCLAELFPGRSVQLAAFDAARGWILSNGAGDLMWRFGDEGIRCSTEQLIEGVTQFARMQIDSLDHIDSLLNCSCPDRRIDYPGSIARVFSHLKSRLDDLASSPKVDHLLESLERARACFERLLEPLAMSRVPGCLVHSDFHAGNMAIDPASGRPVLFDWGDCSIGHPYLSLHTCLNHPSARADGCAEALRSAYLECWEAIAPREAIEQSAGCAPWIHALNEFELATGWLEHLHAGSTAFDSAIATILEAFDSAIKVAEAGAAER